MIWPFNRKTEKRSSGAGYTSQMIASRTDYITGTSGQAELCAAVQSAVSLWENGLSIADVKGTNILSRSTLAIAGRMLALRGEAIFYITDNSLISASDWDLTTKLGKPVAYRLTLPDVGGGATVTALADEVLHFRIGADANQPWQGTAPLRRANLSAKLLQVIEAALVDVYVNAPLGSAIVPMPETPEADLADIARKFRGSRGTVLVRESVNVQAAGGPAPAQDWKANDLTPDLSRANLDKSLNQARDQINSVFGILPALNSATTTGPMVREAQRHLAQWTLQPMAELMADEASQKLSASVSLDVLRPLQAFDAGGRARAMMGVIQALSQAKDAGIDPEMALQLVDWKTE